MTLKNSWHQPKRLGATAVMVALLLQTVSPAHATVLQVPGIYQAPPLPNVMFSLDDSGSMTSDAIPDYLSDTTGMPATSSSNFQDNAVFPNMWKAGTQYLAANRAVSGTQPYGNYYQSSNPIARYLRSAAGNPLYYDPTVRYQPWPRSTDDTARYDNATTTAVNIHPSDPFATTGNSVVNLTVRVNRTAAALTDPEGNGFWPATYYVYNGTTPLPPANPNTSLNVATAFTKWEIQGSGSATFPRGANRTDCSGSVGPNGCTRTEELQNFANWLQYYRSRSLMAKGGVAAAFAQQGTNLRVGFTTINTGANVARGVTTFTGTARTNFYTSLYGTGTPSSTPLREAMDHVGKYFQGGTTRGNPWAENTSQSPTRADSCRKSFHIMSTDGFWNGNNASTPARNDNDFFATTETTPPQPSPSNATFAYSDSGTPGTLAARFTVNPYRDNNTSNTNTLANVAAYYWKTDLQGGTGSTGTIENRVGVTSRDPAFWQHLTTFTVGLGISGSGTARPADAALSSVDPISGAQVVSLATPTSSLFYPYRGKPWLSDPDLRDLLVAQRTPMRWPTATADAATTGDDLIHAAMNGHGRYFSATNPTELATGIGSALAEATNQNTAFASLGLASTNETATDNRLYQAIYNPLGWTGRLYAFGLSNGSFSTTVGNELWEASRAMPAPANRNIFTWNPAVPTPQGSLFTWAGLNGTQQAALGPVSGTGTGSSLAERQDVLEYLRGSAAREAQNAGPLRDRVRDTATTPTAGVLGDIVGGSPIKGPSTGAGYNRLPTTTASNMAAKATYPLYRAAEASGTNSPVRDLIRTVFFGANDGMLHAVNANDNPSDPFYVANQRGVERFAYVPNSVFSVPRTTYSGTTATVNKLYELSRPDYAHLFTVNAPPQIADAYIKPSIGNSTGWKSVLVGATGAGSRGIFALDVTSPDVGTGAEQFNTSKVLWEFSEVQSPDMGHMPSYANVGLMRDGTWVAIVGNGYDSSTGQAKLFLINLETGAVIWEPTVGTAGGNGLSQPNFLLNSNREVIAIWAGDLRGNMWKFDVSSAIRADWHVAYGGNPLFTTPANQPITVMPELEQFPNTQQAMVIFGTGKLFDTQDTSTDSTVNPNLTRQAIYGIWDNEASRVTNLSQLTEQTILPGATGGFMQTSDTAIDWATKRGWYLQLDSGTGERVHVNPVIPVKGRAVPVFVIANTPSNEPCNTGGNSRVFALDPVTGRTPAFSVFDANNDNSLSATDGRRNVYLVSGSMLSSPRFLTTAYSGGVTQEKPGSRGQTGALEGGVEFGTASSECISTGRMIAGKSDTSGENLKVGLGACKGRVSWRQIQ